MALPTGRDKRHPDGILRVLEPVTASRLHVDHVMGSTGTHPLSEYRNLTRGLSDGSRDRTGAAIGATEASSGRRAFDRACAKATQERDLVV